MKTKHFLIFLIISILSACSNISEHCQQANAAMFYFSKEQQQKNGLVLAGFGGAMMYDIQEFALHYNSPKINLNEAQAQALFLEVAYAFLERVNNDVKIRPFLHDYPITLKNIDLSISFLEDDYMRAPKDYVALIANNKNSITTWHYDHFTEKFCSKSSITVEEEPLEKEPKIVNSELPTTSPDMICK